MVVFLSGAEISIAQDAADTQSAPVVAAMLGGGFIAVWSDPDSNNPDIYARVYNAAGQAMGAEFRVNDQSGGIHGAPAVTALVGGEIMIGWTSTDGGVTEMQGRVLDASGQPVGADVTLSADLDGIQGTVSFAALSEGGFVAAWSAGPTALAQIKACQFHANGAPLGSAFEVGTVPALTQSDPVIAVLAGGSFAIAWANSQPNDDIKVQLFAADGSPNGTEFTANVGILGKQDQPAIAALTDGTFVLTWQSVVEGKNSILARHFDADGVALRGEFVVADSVDGQRFPAVTSLADGGYSIAWQEIIGGNFGDIHMRQFDSDDTPLCIASAVNTPDDPDQSLPQMALLTDGRLVVLWRDDGDIAAQIVDARIRTLIGGSGTIDGQDTAPQLLVAGDNLTVSLSAELSVTNQHCIQSDGSDGDEVTVSVHGKVIASDGDIPYDAVHLRGTSGSAITIFDTGVIQSTDGMAVRLEAGGNTLTNDGLIEGQSIAILGGAGSDRVTNTGQITGNVQLGDGSDFFDGRGGLVDGWVAGGNGNDTYVVSATAMTLVEHAEGGTDLVRSSVSQTLGANIENLSLIGATGLRGSGNILANVILGTVGNDRLSGNLGNDRLAGGNGQDRLSGGDGDDSLSGGAGNDRVTGGIGRDLLTGGLGTDVFVFETALSSAAPTPDQITDFRHGADKIDLSALVGQKLVFRGFGGFADDVAQLRLKVSGADTLIQIDLNGDHRADMAVLVTGAKALFGDDFIL